MDDLEESGPEASTPTSNRLSRWAPLLLSLIPVLVTLWLTRVRSPEIISANDLAVHQAFTAWARNRIAAGHFPMDGWFPYLTGGLPAFHQYQSLGHQVIAAIEVVTGAHNLTEYSMWILLGTWPLCLYSSVRLLGAKRWEACIAAYLALLPTAVPLLGYELRSYLASGVWTQLLGMWLFPLALALTLRAIQRGRGYALAILVSGGCVAVHYPTGFLLMLMIGLMPFIRPSAIKQRFPRAALIGLGSAAVASFTIVPLLEDSRYLGISENVRDTYLGKSHGGRQVLAWLVGGGLFDAGRAPVLTVLVLLGGAVCLLEARRSDRHRLLLLLFVVSILLFSGSSVVGPVLKFIPGASEDLQLNRYIIGVHLAGLLMAASGLLEITAALLRWMQQSNRVFARPTLVRAGILVLILAVLVVPGRDRVEFLNAGGATQNRVLAAQAEQRPLVNELVRRATHKGPGRFYGGSLFGPNSPPANKFLAKLGIVGGATAGSAFLRVPVDSIGFNLRTAALPSDVELRFDESLPAHYRLWNVRYLVLPKPVPPQVPTRQLATNDWVTLYEVDGVDGNYLRVVDTVGPAIEADRYDIGKQMEGFLASSDLRNDRYNVVAFDGDRAATPTLRGAADGSAGRTVSERVDLEEGRFTATVEASRRAAVLLPAGYHPRLKARVDGEPARIDMVAPGFMTVPIDQGRHRVEIFYECYQYYWVWFLLAAVVLIAAALLPRRVALLSTPSSDGTAPTPGSGDPVNDRLSQGDGDERSPDQGGAERDVFPLEPDHGQTHDDADERG